MTVPDGDATLRAWLAGLAQKIDRVSYYELLSVAPTAAAKEVRDAYFKAVSRLHPDLYATRLDQVMHDQLVSIYSRVVEAYRTLIDPSRRVVYDRGLGAGRLRWSSTHDLESRRDPDVVVLDEGARKFFRLARAALEKGDARGAVMHLKIALSREPKNAVLLAELAEAEERSRSS